MGLAVVAAAQVNRPYAELAALQHIPSLAALIAILFLASRGRIGVSATACAVLFVILHTVGGRYLYTYTPYDDWLTWLVGSGPSDWFGWTRNHYDRLVHFAFGLLSVLPFTELAYGRVSRTVPRALFAAVSFVLAVSAVYEIFEWALTLVMSGEGSERYNGQQGDFWDAQKDMALAGLGAVIAATALRVANR